MFVIRITKCFKFVLETKIIKIIRVRNRAENLFFKIIILIFRFPLGNKNSLLFCSSCSIICYCDSSSGIDIFGKCCRSIIIRIHPYSIFPILEKLFFYYWYHSPGLYHSDVCSLINRFPKR